MGYNKRRSRVLNHLFFVGPAFLFFLIVVLIPFLLGTVYSFSAWNGISTNITWVGFDNFHKIFTNDSQFLDSFVFTTKFTVAAVLFTNLIGFLFALALTSQIKTRNLLRTAFFLPNVIGGLILGFIWQFIFIRGFPAIGDFTGFSIFKLPWLGDASTAFWGLVIVFAWQISGYIMVVYIAALQSIDFSLLEAAKIDGANKLQILFRIIFPLVVPAFTVCTFLTLSWAFKIFDLNLALTNGGPYDSSQSIALNIYLEAFQFNRYGLGTAKALVFFVIVAAISIMQVYLMKRKEVQY